MTSWDRKIKRNQIAGAMFSLRDVDLAVEIAACSLREQGALDGELDVLRSWVIEQLEWWRANPEDRAFAYGKHRDRGDLLRSVDGATRKEQDG